MRYDTLYTVCALMMGLFFTTAAAAQVRPPELSAVGGDQRVTLTMGYIEAENWLGFHVERAPTVHGPWSRVTAVPVQSDTYVDMGIPTNTTLYYRVYAVISGEDPASAPRSSAVSVSVQPINERVTSTVLAYEDTLGLGANDWDYNDFVVNVISTETFAAGGQLEQLTIQYDPLARGSAFVQEFHQRIPIAGDYNWYIYYYSPYNLSTPSDFKFGSGSGVVDLMIFEQTSAALPGQDGTFANTTEAQPVFVPGQRAVLVVEVANPAANIDGSYDSAPWDAYIRMPYLTGLNEVHRLPYGGLTELSSSPVLQGLALPFVVLLNADEPLWPCEGVPIWAQFPTFVSHMRNFDMPNWSTNPLLTSSVWSMNWNNAVQQCTSPISVFFADQPQNGSVDEPLDPVRVVVVGTDGQILSEANISVTIELGENPGGATLTGTTSLSSSNGEVTFSDLVIDAPATGYSLVAKIDGLPDATSDNFNVGLASDVCVRPIDNLLEEVQNAPCGDDVVTVKNLAELNAWLMDTGDHLIVEGTIASAGEAFLNIVTPCTVTFNSSSAFSNYDSVAIAANEIFALAPVAVDADLHLRGLNYVGFGRDALMHVPGDYTVQGNILEAESDIEMGTDVCMAATQLTVSKHASWAGPAQVFVQSRQTVFQGDITGAGPVSFYSAPYQGFDGSIELGKSSRIAQSGNITVSTSTALRNYADILDVGSVSFQAGSFDFRSIGRVRNADAVTVQVPNVCRIHGDLRDVASIGINCGSLFWWSSAGVETAGSFTLGTNDFNFFGDISVGGNLSIQTNTYSLSAESSLSSVGTCVVTGIADTQSTPSDTCVEGGID